VNNCKFNSNLAPTDETGWTPGNGGALYCGESAVAEVSKSSFLNNSGYYGGAIAVQDNSRLILSDSVFENNTSLSPGASGGAISYMTITVPHTSANRIINSSFKGNTAPLGSGGALASQADAAIEITNSTFERHSSTSGGAIHSFSSTPFSLSNCLFSENQSSGPGGAVHLTGSNTHATFANCSFLKNRCVSDDIVLMPLWHIYGHHGHACQPRLPVSQCWAYKDSTMQLQWTPSLVDCLECVKLLFQTYLQGGDRGSCSGDI
jgi:predicted outer membrane repeat protein